MTTDMERLGNSKLWFMTLGLLSKNPRNFKQIEKQKKIEIGKIFPQPHKYIYYYMILVEFFLVESRILENLLVEISRILGFGIRKYPAQGLRNPTTDGNPESQLQTGIHCLESGIHCVESRILDCL